MLDSSNIAQLAKSNQQVIIISDYYSHEIVAPNSWEKVLCSEICQIIGGSQPPKEYFINEPQEGYIRLIQIRDYKTDKFATYIPIELAKRFCQKEDIMIGRYGPPIFQILRGLEGAYNVALMKAEPNTNLFDKEFLYYFLQTPQLFNYVASASLRTAGQDGVRKELLDNYPVFVPPLNEQRRIVAKIEALKARSQRVKEELEAIPALLNQFRQSVLAAAFRGDLTADWREKNPDVESASVLLERIRAERRSRWEEAELEKMKAQGKTPKDDKWKEKYKEFLPVNNPSVFEKSVIPTQWSWVTIGDVAECLDKMRVPINKDEREKRIGDIPYYGANGQVGWIDDYIFDEALVVVVEDETFIGRTKPFCYKISGKSWVNNHAHVLRATDGVEIDYINYSLMFYPFIPLTSGSTGRRKLTQAALMSAPYPVAPLAEQQEIVRRVELFFKTAEQIEQQYQEAKAYLDKLNQSILAKAFRGELVPQDPNDEPASVLLERIRAEREKLDTKKKAKGKTEKKSRKEKPELTEPKQLSLPGFE